MSKRPAFQFYPGDWLRDTALRSCPIEARGLWADLLCLMHDGQPYGHLAVNDVPLTDAEVAPMVGLPIGRYRKLLGILETKRVARRSDTGALYSYRMVKDEAIRHIRQESGKLGGNPLLTGEKAYPIAPRLVKQPDKQSVAHADKEVVGSSGGGVGEGCPELGDRRVDQVTRELWDSFPEGDLREGFARVLRSAKADPFGWLCMVRSVIRGEPSGRPIPPAIVARAILDGARTRPAIEAFCRSLMQAPDKKPGGRMTFTERERLRALEKGEVA